MWLMLDWIILVDTIGQPWCGVWIKGSISCGRIREGKNRDWADLWLEIV